MAQEAEPGQPHPSQDAPRQADARAHRQGQCRKSKVRARVEHVFAWQKNQLGLFIRTIGIKRAEAKITLTNKAYNMHT